MGPAFTDPVISAQATFRAILDAIARPGDVKPVHADFSPPLPMSPAMGAIALSLLDQDTPVWLDMPLAAAPEVPDWIRFHTGAPVVSDPRESAFAFVREAMRLPPLDVFDPGSAEYPDRSTTVVIHVDSWQSRPALELAGPGIKKTKRFSAGPLPADMVERLAANRELFPRGVDLVLASEDAVAAFPRSVRVVNRGA